MSAWHESNKTCFIINTMDGRNAEEMVVGNDKASIGAFFDTQNAVWIAKSTVTAHGISGELKALDLNNDEEYIK